MEKQSEKVKLHVSVRDLVEFIFREGDIDNRAGRLAQSAMMEGSRIHRKIQQSMGAGYEAEVPLALCIEAEEYVLEVEGRADGIFYMTGEAVKAIREEEGLYDQLTLDLEEKRERDDACGSTELRGERFYIDEIKGVYRNIAVMERPQYVHLAQAMCYAYIYALQNGQEQMGVQMTYCNLDTEIQRHFREEFTFRQLAEKTSGEHRWTCVSLPVPGGAERAGVGRVPDDKQTENSVFAGSNRSRKDNLHHISGGEGAGGGAGGQYFLSDRKDGDGGGGKGDLCTFVRAGICGQNHSAHGEGKALSVRGDGLQSGAL